jgi:hypothetical protein
LAAERLHASIYVARGYIKAGELTDDGRLDQDVDPHKEASTYFVVKNSSGEVVAAARQISGHLNLPTYKMDLFPNARQKLDRVAPGRLVEISGLVKVPGESSIAALMLYRAMWQYSIMQGHKVWLMACDEDFFPRLVFLFGKAVQKAGEPVHYLGSQTIPAMVDVTLSFEQLVGQTRHFNPLQRRLHQAMVKFFLHGMPVETLPVSLRQKLKRAGFEA